MTDEDIKIKMIVIMTEEIIEKNNKTKNNIFKKRTVIKIAWKNNRVKDKEIAKAMLKKKTTNKNKPNLRKKYLLKSVMKKWHLNWNQISINMSQSIILLKNLMMLLRKTNKKMIRLKSLTTNYLIHCLKSIEKQVNKF